ncbi:CbtA family protein [Nocardioides panacisoli]|uniref:CbtA family protein n=1 Tax=Nocardioides panacisoli TaxID=627624 RepID=A0ABP7INN4_9ACTN
MTPRAFLLRGLLVGLVAGALAFVVASLVGEPYVERAIAIEESSAAHAHIGDEAGHEPARHEHSEEAPVPRDDQRTWGLATGTLAIGVTYGGIAALAAAGAVGRLGRLGARQSTALVALLGFVSTVLLPFLKYPANPPSVGNPDTIGSRTGDYFAMQLICVAGVVLAVLLAVRLARRLGGFEATVAAGATYLAVIVGAALLLPTVDEVGDFPADLLWSFRVSSLMTSATLWATIGIGLVALVGRLHDRVVADSERRALAAAL